MSKKKIDGRINNGGARENAGAPKKYAENDLARPVTTTVAIPIMVKNNARKKHGTLSAALKFAATYGPDAVIGKKPEKKTAR